MGTERQRGVPRATPNKQIAEQALLPFLLLMSYHLPAVFCVLPRPPEQSAKQPIGRPNNRPDDRSGARRTNWPANRSAAARLTHLLPQQRSGGRSIGPPHATSRPPHATSLPSWKSNVLSQELPRSMAEPCHVVGGIVQTIPRKRVGILANGNQRDCPAGNPALFHNSSGNPWPSPATQCAGFSRGSRETCWVLVRRPSGHLHRRKSCILSQELG